MLLRSTAVTVTVLTGLACPPPADASCDYRGPLCQTWRSYDAIFDGTVRSIERVNREEDIAGRKEKIGHRLVTFEVHDSWRGAVANTIQLFLWGGYEWTVGGGFHVEVSKRYLIFASRTQDGELTTGCSPSRQYEEQSTELAFLKSLRQPAKGARVFGRTFQAVNPFDSLPIVTLEPTVTLAGEGITRKAVAHDGRYEFSGLTPGTYSVEAEAFQTFGGHESRLVSLTDERSCAARDFYYHPDTSISGILLLPNGQAASGVSVEIAPARMWRKEPYRRSSARTDDFGRFELRAVPPGELIVGLNLFDDVRYNPRPRTLYGDTGDAQPEVIHVGAGQHVVLSSWTIGPALPEVTMRLQLSSPDGNPLRSMEIDLLDVTDPTTPEYARHVMGSRTDANGWVEFTGRSTRKYAIARSTEWSDEHPPQSQPFTAELAAKGVRVIVPDWRGRRGPGYH